MLAIYALVPTPTSYIAPGAEWSFVEFTLRDSNSPAYTTLGVYKHINPVSYSVRTTYVDSNGSYLRTMWWAGDALLGGSFPMGMYKTDGAMNVHYYYNYNEVDSVHQIFGDVNYEIAEIKVGTWNRASQIPGSVTAHTIISGAYYKSQYGQQDFGIAIPSGNASWVGYSEVSSSRFDVWDKACNP